ncbi:Repeat domain-containing protein [Chitinophaga ginsengisegetis]|uniref:Repeat domain-containing protein n=1 Tax=Chitinophaga ginsengisegetis TaxID=393003 RepID=A0A1T5N3Y3_9BACT|nr:FG-GAP and VCBS repeat-containing protein [Chitinophaga ginsengisegetis]SKC95176.1 Repeat domain-containing protein [Chitinophaga ginsengisegetis]
MGTKTKATDLPLVWSVALILLYGCAGNKADHRRAIAEKYCSSCHQFPEPDLLPVHIWANGVLPTMGAFADIYKDRSGEYKLLPPALQQLRDPAIASMRTAIPLDDWNEIVAWYTTLAPEEIAQPEFPVRLPGNNFSLKLPPKKSASFTSCIYYDEKAKLLFQSDINKHILRVSDPALRQLDSLDNSTVVDMAPAGAGRYLLTHIGSLNPGGVTRNGAVEEITIAANKIVKRKILYDGLYRPVQSLMLDDELVVCEFGFMEGGLSIFTKAGKKVIVNLPGAERMYVEDIDGDGKKDIWVLFAQGKEGIFQLLNKGNGNFELKEVLTFPPSYGATYFQLADMDGDGRRDIIFTCGDNADQSPVLKPYHGIYIFRNMGNTYRQVFFQPLYGCYKAVPVDLDKDGRLDLAAISFFADFAQHPDLALTYLLQKKEGKFELHTDKQVAGLGRWVCMDVKDFNGDGKPDIIAGNMAAKPGNNQYLMKYWMNGPEFIIWENRY